MTAQRGGHGHQELMKADDRRAKYQMRQFKLNNMKVWAGIALLICVVSTSCKGPYQIRDNGLTYMTLGDPMPETGTIRLKRLPVRDTIFFENDFTWRASIVKYPQGKVYIEADFLGQETVNRIRIESPDLKVDKQYHVGAPVSSLATWASEWEITYIDAYEVYDLVAIDRPNIHFLVKESAGNTWKKPDQFPEAARVFAIVVM